MHDQIVSGHVIVRLIFSAKLVVATLSVVRPRPTLRVDGAATQGPLAVDLTTLLVTWLLWGFSLDCQMQEPAKPEGTFS